MINTTSKTCLYSPPTGTGKEVSKANLFILVSLRPRNKTTRIRKELPTMSDNQTVSAEEVAKHSKEDDCWIVVNGKVYDLTKFAPSHPGGAEGK